MIKSKLKVLLAEHELTQQQLADKIGTRQATISSICNNKIKQIPVGIVNDICELFNCQISDIFTYITDKKKHHLPRYGEQQLNKYFLVPMTLFLRKEKTSK